MAKMYPPYYDGSTGSSAEKKVFELLKTDPGTESWTVLHSLGLSERSGKPYGEIDFVIIVPGAGIVCLEIKGGRISCKDGVWYTTDRNDRIHRMSRSPFMQAREGMFALREAVTKKLDSRDDFHKCTISYQVVFPDVSRPPQTPEFERWEVIDRTDLQHPVSRSISQNLLNQQKKLGNSTDNSLPSSAMVKSLIGVLRPDFELIVSKSTRIHRSKSKLLSLTEKQYDVLDRLSENPRCLIKGAAGTGKTVLAIEHARRCAKENKRTLLLCYNRLLGVWFEEQIQGETLITSSRYFRFLRNLISESSYAEEYLNEEKKATDEVLFSEILPVYGELAAIEHEDEFDVLVLDEGQDLLNSNILRVLNHLLKSDLSEGSWSFYGDFTNQSIYSSVGENGFQNLDKYTSYYTKELLTINCRNTRQIAEETVLLAGFPTPPFRFSSVEGLSVDYRYWSDENEELYVLSSVIQDLLKQGVSTTEIVILSPRSYKNSIASQIKSNRTLKIIEYKTSHSNSIAKNEIAFSTIHAFKGMESPVVVLCDFDRIEHDEPQALLYVGMSRASSLLMILLHKKNKSAMRELTKKKLGEEWSG